MGDDFLSGGCCVNRCNKNGCSAHSDLPGTEVLSAMRIQPSAVTLAATYLNDAKVEQ